MTEQQIKQAQEAVNLLDRAAAMAAVSRADHVSIQLSSQFLRELIATEANHNAAQVPLLEQPSAIRCLPDVAPEKAAT